MSFPARLLPAFTLPYCQPAQLRLRRTHTSAHTCHRVRMCEETPPSAAEQTRRALSETKPLVKFRREELPEEDAGFAYTSGVEKGLDVWLISGVLFFLVPILGFVWGVATGNIDVNPR